MEDATGHAVTVLGSLAGTWRGHGTVTLPSMPSRTFDEEVRFVARSPVSLDYWQRATDRIDGTMLHSEAGILRVIASGSLELSVALPGATEVSEGSIEASSISLASIAIGRAASGARLVATTRRYVVSADAITYDIEIATESFPLFAHIRGELRITPEGDRTGRGSDRGSR